MGADVDTAGPLTVRDLPKVEVPGRGIVPQDIAGAVVIEITDTTRLPAERVRARIDTGGPLAVGELPDLGGTGRGIVPKDVAGPVVIEIADAGRQRAGRMRAEVDAGCPVRQRQCDRRDVEVGAARAARGTNIGHLISQ